MWKLFNLNLKHKLEGKKSLEIVQRTNSFDSVDEARAKAIAKQTQTKTRVLITVNSSVSYSEKLIIITLIILVTYNFKLFITDDSMININVKNIYLF